MRAVLFVVVLASCVQQLPPPQVARAMPDLRQLRAAPPVAGRTRVVIDLVDGPARVEQVVEDSSVVRPDVNATDLPSWYTPARVAYTSSVSRYVCRTPCITHLPAGRNHLHFLPLDPALQRSRFAGSNGSWNTSEGERRELHGITFTLGTEPTLLRVALGQRRDNGWLQFAGIFAVGIGAAMTATAIAFLPSSLSSGTPEVLGFNTWMLFASGLPLTLGALVLATEGRPPGVLQPAGFQQWILSNETLP